MDREEKIGSLIECLQEHNIKIIDTKNIQGLIIDAEVDKDTLKESLNDEGEDKGINDEDLDGLFKFLDGSGLVLVDIYNVSGVSFENCEYYVDSLYESNLWDGE